MATYCFVCDLYDNVAHIVRRTPGNGWWRAAWGERNGDTMSPALCGIGGGSPWCWLEHPRRHFLCETCANKFVEAEGYVLQESNDVEL